MCVLSLVGSQHSNSFSTHDWTVEVARIVLKLRFEDLAATIIVKM